ncbi:MAG: hypothetical protein V3U32_06690 [Anaerolineales bacterium]
MKQVPKAIRGIRNDRSAIRSTTTRKSRAWVALFVLGILLVLNMLFLLIVGGGPDQFEIDTGVAWTELSDAYPSVAAHVTDHEQLIAIGFLGFALFVSVIAYVPYRAGEKWSWYATWILPGILAVTAAGMIINGSTAIGGMYGALSIVAALAMLISMRVFFPKP